MYRLTSCGPREPLVGMSAVEKRRKRKVSCACYEEGALKGPTGRGGTEGKPGEELERG